MGMFDGILGNIEDVAGKLGIPADKVQAAIDAVQAKVADGGDHMSALGDVAKEHGISLDSLQGMLGGAGTGAQDMLGKLTSSLDKDGDGNPLNDLGSIAKGFFSKD